jgi:hypothetical protein
MPETYSLPRKKGHATPMTVGDLKSIFEKHCKNADEILLFSDAEGNNINRLLSVEVDDEAGEVSLIPMHPHY